MDSDEGFVKQDESVFANLSPEALAALKDLAVDKGLGKVEGEKEDDVGVVLKKVRNHFDAVKVGEKEEVVDYCYGGVSFELKGIKQSLGKTLDSTGLTVWRAAETLCEWIVKNEDRFEGKKICELGGGLGLVSILLAKLNNNSLVKPPVICTDGDEISLKLLRSNISFTDCEERVISQKLYWGEGHEEFLEQHNDIDVIVAADVIYEDYQVEALISSVVAIFQSRSEARTVKGSPVQFFLSYARRLVPITKVTDTLTANGLKSEAIFGDVEPILFITAA